MTIIQKSESGLRVAAGNGRTITAWRGNWSTVATTEEAIRAELLCLEDAVFVLRSGEQVGVTHAGSLLGPGEAGDAEVLAILPTASLEHLGDPTFCACYGTRYAYYGGAMANGIASVEMVVALGKAGFLGSFGSAGMFPTRVESAIQAIQSALPDGPYAFNVIHSPHEPALERRNVELYLT